MSELTLKEKQRIMRAAEIEVLGNMGITKQIFELHDLLDAAKEELVTKVTFLKESTESEFERVKGSTEENLQSQVERLEQAIEEINDCEEETRELLENIKAASALSINSLTNRFLTEINNVRSLIPTLPDLNLFSSDLMAHIMDKMEELRLQIPPLVIETPEIIRDKLETLKDEERLDKSAIKGLEDFEQRLLAVEKKKNFSVFGGGGSTTKNMVQVYDLSPLLDGSTKTFSLPAFRHIISVQSNSAPIVFRPTIDYTSNGSNFSITFTDQIVESATLAAGQSVIVIYSEL